MAIDFACECGRQFRVKDEQAGRRAKCPSCTRELVVPQAPLLPPLAPTYGASAYAPPPQQQQQQYPAAGGYAAQGGYPQQPAPQAWPPAQAAVASPMGYRPARGGLGALPGKNFHRTSLFVILGIILLLGCFLPVVEAYRDYSSTYSSSYSPYSSRSGSYTPPPLKWRAQFVNFQALTERDVPFVIRVFCIAPLLAGIAVLIVAGTSRGVVRGSVTGGSGLLPFLILFIFLATDRDASRMIRRLFSEVGGGLGFLVVLALLGTGALLAGLLAARHRPEYRPISIIALVGGALYALCHFIPAGDGVKTMPIVAAFTGPESNRMFDEAKGMGLMRVCDILQLLAGLTVAALCIVWASTNKLTRERARVLLFVLMAAVAVGIIGKVGLLISNSDDTERLTPALLTGAKMVMWILGLMILVPVGLSELLLGLAARGDIARATGRGFAEEMNPPAAAYPPGGYQQGGYPPQDPYQQQTPYR